MPNPSSYFLGSSFVLKPAPASLPSSVAPTFAGISGLTQNADGSLQASWSAASLVPNPPVKYEIYIQQGSVFGLFNVLNLQNTTTKLTAKIEEDANGNVLQIGANYFVGVRAIDAYGNRETNTISLNQTISFANFNTVASAVWDVVRATRNTLGTFGEALTARVDVDVSTRAATADSRFANLDATVSSRLASADTRLNSLSNLDTTVSSRAATADTRFANLDATISSRATSAEVTAIQNNTNFVGIVPTSLILPKTGSKDYPLYVRLFNSAGAPADPDLNQISLEIKDSSGGTVLASTLMTKTATGQYVYNYTVNSTDVEQSLYVFFTYAENSIAFNQVRATEVVEFESKLDTLLTLITPTRAGNLDNLDASVSSRSTQTSVTAINTKLGTPAGATMSADIANIQAAVDAVPTAGENADAVWDEDVNAHATGTTTARTLKDAKIFSQIDL